MKHVPLRVVAAWTAAAGTAALGAGCSAADDPDPAGPADRGSGTYVAGEYTAEGAYTTPGGQEKIEVKVSLGADGTIADLTVTPLGINPNSKKFQGKFSEGIGAVAKGQSIETLSVDKVAGSSLSSGGFNAALDAIAAQAKA